MQNFLPLLPQGNNPDLITTLRLKLPPRFAVPKALIWAQHQFTNSKVMVNKSRGSGLLLFNQGDLVRMLSWVCT